MLKVIYKTDGTGSYAFHLDPAGPQMRKLTLKPGLNELDDDAAALLKEAAEKIDVCKRMIADGTLRTPNDDLADPPAPPAAKSSEPSDEDRDAVDKWVLETSELNAGDAIERIEKTSDTTLLESLLTLEDRKTVRGAAEARLAELHTEG